MANTYSGEDLARLENIISESNALIKRQEEIIDKIIDGENKIGDVRLGNLDKFFDTYSKKLDVIARKTSELGDAFLILEGLSAQHDSRAAAQNQRVREVAQRQQSNNAEDEYAPTSERRNYNGNNSGGDRNAGDTTPDSGRDAMAEEYGKIIQRLDALTQFFEKQEEERRNDIEDPERLKGAQEEINELKKATIAELQKEIIKGEKDLERSLREIEVKRHESAQGSELALLNLANARIASQQAAANADSAALDGINSLNAQLEYYSLKDGAEAGEARFRELSANDDLESSKELKAKLADYEARKILEARRKNNGILTQEAMAEIKKESAAKFKADKETLDKLTKERNKIADLEAKKREDQERRSLLNQLTGKGSSWEERKQAWQSLTQDESGEFDKGKATATAITALDQGIKALSSFAQKLETQIDNIGSYQGDIDTRLQGSSLKKSSGSYWRQVSKDITSVGAVTPFFKQEDFAKNVKSLVDRGIAFDLEQRAFLMTIQDKIANTFNVADGTLLKLIRIQQEDSTAGRLGMESALNAFLNEMYETSEYLSGVADNVRSSLVEMESLMSGAAATEVEYQVQKWLGSLYSVGMSDSAVQAISSAFGQLASGQIEGLEGGTGSLLVMAANDAGLSIADLLTDGIDASDTNKLLQAVVNYLAELSESAKDNQVVQQQLANVFGVKASDLKAATNLVLPGSTDSISGSFLSYDNMMRQLYNMAGSMYKRTSAGEMLSNVMANAEYSLANGLATNPIAYMTYKAASMLENTTGGIALPFVNVMGFGVDLNTTVADLMRVGSMSAGILSSLGEMISGLGSSFNGQAMLNKMGIKSGSGLVITPRGDGGMAISAESSSSTSSSGYIGNSSSSDIKDSTLQEAEDSKKQQMIEAKEEAEENQVDILNTAVIKIYELLDDVAHGSGSLKVRVEGYGLTKAGNSGGSSGALGGVEALNSATMNSGGGLSNGLGASSGSSYSFSTGGVNSGGVGGSIDTGAWIMY